MADMKMKAARLHDYGGPEALVVEEATRPLPGPEHVLVHIKAAGVNPADWKMAQGMFKHFSALQFPWTPGLEAAGVIEALGPNVRKFRKGQEVYGVLSSSYAQYAVVKDSDIQPKPSGLSFEEAASIPVGALTAWGAVVNTANVRVGQRVLIHGGAGGVGAYAVQLAHWRGAHVTATASAANAEFVRTLGADAVIDYNAGPFESQVHGLDAVIDTVGGELAGRSFKVLRPDGIYVTVAGRLAEGAGKTEGIRATGAGRAPAETLSQISELIATKRLHPVVGKVFPLSEARQALELSETGHGRGRIILLLDK